ncbi:hypothetical protein QYF36_011192 [Acer negundo]|nr:hypothetical protein QYF36_011192 [Acer negundo]
MPLISYSSFLSICFSLNLKYHDLFFLLFYGKSKENRSSNRRSSLENRNHVQSLNNESYFCSSDAHRYVAPI